MLASFHFCHQCSYCAAMEADVMYAEPAAPETEAAPREDDVSQDDLTAEDLIEEVSIDGMCGVY